MTRLPARLALSRDARYVNAISTGRYDKLLADQKEIKRFEQWALRVANTPGNRQIVLALTHHETNGRAWKTWLVYDITDTIQTTDRVALDFNKIYMSDPDTGPPQPPDELQDHPIFEAQP